jgi:hypothetical protein
MLNISSLFHTTSAGEQSLLGNLDLTADEREALKVARKQIRECLREGIPAVLHRNGYEEDVPTPRFFTQGSWSYKTINAPAQSPQQADLDDGAYLPMSFVQQEKRPSHASKIFFAAAEEALKPLCEKNSWALVTDKPTCIRIELSKKAHIDVPLYAIPDAQFIMLKASMERYGYDSISEAVIRAERDVWTALPEDEVLLAHRDEDWKKSDPRPLKEWFESEVDARGEQLRRVVRYLKAYRDWQWTNGGPSSILLMAAAVPLFRKFDGRDDLALSEVVEGLPAALRNGVSNPTDASESLTDRLGHEAVGSAAERFEELHRYLKGAIDSSSASQACQWLVEKFGARFPNDPARVKVQSPSEKVAATAAIAGPSEIVGTTKSA